MKSEHQHLTGGSCFCNQPDQLQCHKNLAHLQGVSWLSRHEQKKYGSTIFLMKPYRRNHLLILHHLLLLHNRYRNLIPTGHVALQDKGIVGSRRLCAQYESCEHSTEDRSVTNTAETGRLTIQIAQFLSPCHAWLSALNRPRMLS